MYLSFICHLYWKIFCLLNMEIELFKYVCLVKLFSYNLEFNFQKLS